MSRDGREPLLEALRDKLRNEEGKQIYKKRGYTVEPVFGQLKWDGRKPLMDLCGLVKLRGEFLLMCPSAQCEEDREESAPGHTHFTWEV